MAKSKKKKSGLALGKWLHLIFTAGIRILFYYPFKVAPYAKHPERLSLEERYARVRKMALLVCRKSRIELHIENKEALSSLNGSSLIVANHLSVMDIVILLALSEKPISFIAKKEVYSMLFIGKCLRCIGGYFLDRDDPKQAVRLFMAAGKEMKEKGRTLVVYPEGTRLKEPFKETQEFHAGTFKLVEWGKADLHCLAEFGTFRPLSKGDKGRSFPIEMAFLPLLSYEDSKGKSTAELASYAHDGIASKVASFQEFDKAYYAKGLSKKKASKWEI